MVGLSARKTAADASLDRDHRETVGDHIVQLSGDRHALLAQRLTGTLGLDDARLSGLLCLCGKVGTARRHAVADKPGGRQRDEHPEGTGPKGGKADHKRAGKRDLGHHEAAQSQAARLLRDDAVAGKGKQDADPERRASADREHHAGAGHNGEHRQRPAPAQPDREAGERDAGQKEQQGDVRCLVQTKARQALRGGRPPGRDGQRRRSRRQARRRPASRARPSGAR